MCKVSRLQTHTLQKASDQGQRKEKNHVCVSLNPRIISLQHSAEGREGRKSKKLLLIIYLLSIAIALSLFVYGPSPSNTRPTKGFRAMSEEGEKSCVCLILYTAMQPSKLFLKKKKDEKARNSELLYMYCLALYLPIV